MYPSALRQIDRKAILVVLAFAIAPLAGCNQKTIPVVQGWSLPVKVTESQDAFLGGVTLYKWDDTIMAVQIKYVSKSKGYAPKCFLLNSNHNAWIETPFNGVSGDYVGVYPDVYHATVALDPASDRVFFEHGDIQNDQLTMNVIMGKMSGTASVQDISGKKWLENIESIFGETDSTVHLDYPGQSGRSPDLGLGIIRGQDLYIPYCISGVTHTTNIYGNAVYECRPFNDGVFRSGNSGDKWQIEKISGAQSWSPSIVRTKDCYYYFAKSPSKERDRDFELWFSKKLADGNSWSAPETVTKTFVYGEYGQYAAVAESDTVHLCWMDVRHKKQKLDIGVFPPHLYSELGNCEIAYCQRKNSDADWSQSVILSKGLLYSYSPSMSVEGNGVIIAWAGSEKGGPNDIYYVTSKNGGKIWTEPQKATDDAKNGIAAGEPQVVLLNGVIHLFYIQGKRESQQIAPGLTKLNQPPWPIYYQQRVFPD